MSNHPCYVSLYTKEIKRLLEVLH